MRHSLRGTLRRSPGLAERRIWGAACDVALADLAAGTALGGALPALAGRAVLLRVEDPLFAAIALVDSGVARRIVLAPPDLADEALLGVLAAAEIDAAVSDGAEPIAGLPTHRVALPSNSWTLHPPRPQRPSG